MMKGGLGVDQMKTGSFIKELRKEKGITQDVVFTDIETGEKYVIEYITSGVSEKIKLEKGKWYTVVG